MNTVFVPTIEWLLNLSPGVWAFEIVSKHEYKYYMATPDYIITTKGVFGINLVDAPNNGPTTPAYLKPLPVASPLPSNTTTGKFKTVTLPKGTKVYKGIGGRADPSTGKREVSFYTLNPEYAARYAVLGGGMGGIIVNKTTRELTGYQHCYHNNDIILELIKGYTDSAAETLLRGVFERSCVDTPDILDVIIRCANVYKIDEPWFVNKHNLRLALGKPSQCLNKVYLGRTDYKANSFILELGAHLGWDFAYLGPEPLIYSYTLNWPETADELVFWRNTDLLERCADDPFDMSNMKKPDRYNIPLLMHQLNSESMERILDWYWANEYKTATLPPSSGLRIMSFNVHGWRPINTDRSKIDLMNHTADIISETKPDIVFLQEHSPTVTFNVAGYTTVIPANPGFLTILTLVKNELTFTNTWSAFAPFRGYRYNREQKGFQCVTVDGLKIVGTHLSIYVGADADIRQAELQQIMAVAPDIICGDFNEPIVKLPNMISTKLHMTTPFHTVDHFLTKRAIDTTYTITTNYSDHLPIFMDYPKK